MFGFGEIIIYDSFDEMRWDVGGGVGIWNFIRSDGLGMCGLFRMSGRNESEMEGFPLLW